MNTTQTAAFCIFLATLSPAQQRALCSITTKFECDAVEAADARPVVDGVDVLSLVGDVNRAMIESIFALPPRR